MTLITEVQEPHTLQDLALQDAWRMRRKLAHRSSNVQSDRPHELDAVAGCDHARTELVIE